MDWLGARGVAYRIWLEVEDAAMFIKHLDLSFAGCGIGIRGACYIANGIKMLHALQVLSLDLSGVPELGVLAVVRALPREGELRSRRARAFSFSRSSRVL